MRGLLQLDRLIVAVAAPLLACLLLAGCGSAGSPTPAGAATRAATESSGSPGPSTGGGTAGAGGDRCTSADLSVALADEDHALAHTYVQLVFTNASRRSCKIGGYPGVSQVDAAGGQLGAPADRTGPAGRTLTLAPGQHARALLTIISPGVQPGCLEQPQIADAVGLRIYPPNDRAAMFLRYADARPACASPTVHQLTVAAILP